MNIIRAMIFSVTIIISWEKPCFCKEYRVKIFDETERKLERFQENVASWNLLSNLFQDDGCVMVVIENFINKNLDWHKSFIRNLQIKTGVSLIVVEISERVKPAWSTATSTNYRNNANMSYILVMDDIRMYSLFLKEAKIITSIWNSRALFMIMTHSTGSTSVHEVFRFMWRTHGIGRVTLFNIATQHVVAYDCLKDTIKYFDVSNFQEITTYYYQQGNDLMGYPIKVLMRRALPMAMAIPDSMRFSDIDQIIFNTLEARMNFTIEIRKPTFRDSFGTVSDTGPIKNSLNQVANREVDMDGDRQFTLNPDLSTSVEFTIPFFNEQIQFVVPKAPKVPIWLSIYHIFDNSIWIPTACLYAISVVLWLCISKFYYNSRFKMHVGSATCINILFLLSGQPVSSKFNKFLERWLLILGSIFAIVVASSFSGHLFQNFSKAVYYPDINSFEELEESGLPIVRGSYDIYHAVKGIEDPIFRKLLQKIDHTNDVYSAFALENGVFDHAVLARSIRIQYEQMKYLTDNNGMNLLHIVEQSVGEFSMAYAVPRGWFFLGEFNSHLSMLCEAGMINKWYTDSMFKYTLQMERAKLKSSKNIPRPFSLSNLRLAWYILTVGLITSFLTFLIELAWHHQILNKFKNTLRPIIVNKGSNYVPRST